ncbi:MAG: CPBP family intramembrane glutamic endopeptidase [Silvanigrellaceae bacterium]
MTSLVGSRWSKSLMYFFSFATVGFGFFIPAFAAAIASVIVLVLSSFLANGRSWSSVMGIGDAKRNAFWFALAFLVSAFLASGVFIGLLRSSADLSIKIGPSLFLVFATVFLQSLVEEVLFRVYLMNHLLTRFVSSRILLCVSSALLFSVAHFLNYRLSEGVSLSFTPLLSLFFFGYSGSAFYLHQGHILGAWGFHAGWNVIRYAVELKINDSRIAESMTFELLEGSWAGLGVGVGLAMLAFNHQLRRKQT